MTWRFHSQRAALNGVAVIRQILLEPVMLAANELADAEPAAAKLTV